MTGRAQPSQPPASTQPMAAPPDQEEGRRRIALLLPDSGPGCGCQGGDEGGQGWGQCVAAGGDGGWTVARLPRWQSGGHELWRPGPGCLMTHGASGSSGHSRGGVASAQCSSAPVLQC